ncbi:hypothetical protein AbraIFM66951_000869 [Aspergillus brasiliensis]|uniref:Uncharacterized protein n=1 Tax=Aspergillus brasiliensis TaxID=319629 RepID=A0A9W5YL96_9EURO|nr:hypothetical protein AbraCBS73388_000879 [Aspergillus brasiliensis]GKZ42162.1 hypothetical protein AbraIFM66951_000869 [Aspergillus brasiliensis]
MCPPEELSSLSPDRLRFPICLVSEDKVDELRLSDDGDAGTDEFGVVPCDDAMELLNAAAAAAGWQWGHMNTLNPRPLQPLQTEFLLLISIGNTHQGPLDVSTDRGAFPAQLRHVSTVRPPMQEVCPGSRWYMSPAWCDMSLGTGMRL